MIAGTVRRGSDDASIMVLGITDADIEQLRSGEAMVADIAGAQLLIVWGPDDRTVATSIRGATHDALGIHGS